MTRSVSRLSFVLGFLSLLLVIPSSGPTPVHAQTPTGYSGGPVTNASFYHIAAGHQDEWLALYKRGIHELSPAWDFFAVIVYRDMDAEVEVQKERAKVMKEVFPNTEEFEAADKKRWELTTEH